MEAVLHEELREACTEGDLAAVRALIHAGADVTAKHASTGVEPLSYAAFHGRWEVAQLLMLHGASPEHAVEEAQRGGFLPLAEYLRIRRARYQREAQAAAVEAKLQKEGEVLARKARFQQQHNEREQRRRGELLAGQVQRAAEHRLLDEQRKEDKAARRAARYANPGVDLKVQGCVVRGVCVRRGAHRHALPFSSLGKRCGRRRSHGLRSWRKATHRSGTRTTRASRTCTRSRTRSRRSVAVPPPRAATTTLSVAGAGAFPPG